MVRFRVGRQDGVGVELGGAAITAPHTVTLTLAAPATGALTVSLGSLRDAAGAAVPTDSSPAALPAWPFVDVPVMVMPSAVD